MKNRMDIINDAVKSKRVNTGGKNIVFRHFIYPVIVYRQVGNRITVLDNFIASIYICALNSQVCEVQVCGLHC